MNLNKLREIRREREEGEMDNVRKNALVLIFFSI